MIILDLPWPYRELSPNARTHYLTLSRMKKKYRRDCCYAALAAHAKATGPQTLSFVFHPPSGHRHDRDNLIASMKSGIDGIADAIKINDREFRLGEIEIGAKVPGGKVRVFISDSIQEDAHD